MTDDRTSYPTDGTHVTSGVIDSSVLRRTPAAARGTR